MGTVDLHALANMPGAGRATQTLRENGLWDEYAGAGPVRDFSAWLSIVTTVAAEMTIKARCKEEACEIILAMAREGRIPWRVALDDDDIEDRLIDLLIDSATGAECPAAAQQMIEIEAQLSSPFQTPEIPSESDGLGRSDALRCSIEK